MENNKKQAFVSVIVYVLFCIAVLALLLSRMLFNSVK